ncbi:16S rRNA (guanine(966)-N(2))-methyltransferase RsmD [Gracilibacillus marinus]|uniref:16S rRNA (Guanine(966)-N(2))-methyltransferase RsmD n=1 Tax=Gracilibacillus marinus TaxID=630535 RepID=A0ABV8VTQ4_9BACI
MRVISGEFKGRKLQSVPNKLTRPTTDKVKESLFHMIGPFFDGGNCLDLFAGSGSLAIEALSRGMDCAILVDKQGQAISTIKANIKTLGLEDRTEIYRNDAFRALKALHKRERNFDLIILDPPYYQTSYEKLLHSIDELDLLNNNGIIVCEHDVKDTLEAPSINWNKWSKDKLGSTTGLTIFTRG